MPPVTIDGTNGITTPMYSGAISANAVTPVNSFKNRIINGNMSVDQRNAGASVTPANQQYTVDRWQAWTSASSKFSVQQNAGSVTPPAGFTNYMGITSLSAYSVGSSDYFAMRQQIEGFNVADLGWGTANAQTVTLSFWVRSSLTGTFGGTLLNNGVNRSYAFTYTISSANTWEQKSITIVGDTTGTWEKTNSTGIYVNFGLGVGSTYSGTAGSWGSSFIISATGATSVVGTNGATFYITGVQLEVGSTATSFDYRPYGTELMLCQRYFLKLGGNDTNELFGNGIMQSSTNAEFIIYMPVRMRATPTTTISGIVSNFGITGPTGFTPTAITFDIYAPNTFRLSATISGATAGYGAYFRAANIAAGLNISAEL
jgi:hypothetical protein